MIVSVQAEQSDELPIFDLIVHGFNRAGTFVACHVEQLTDQNGVASVCSIIVGRELCRDHIFAVRRVEDRIYAHRIDNRAAGQAIVNAVFERLAGLHLILPVGGAGAILMIVFIVFVTQHVVMIKLISAKNIQHVARAVKIHVGISAIVVDAAFDKSVTGFVLLVQCREHKRRHARDIVDKSFALIDCFHIAAETARRRCVNNIALINANRIIHDSVIDAVFAARDRI